MLGSGFKLFGSAGLNLKWHLANDVTLDAAFNPDFAQVEADQVILNLTNFETFLPEKRPFFLEGIDAFSFPLQVFYSRRIGAAPTAPTVGPRATSPRRRAAARHHLRRGQAGGTPRARRGPSARSAPSPAENRVTVVNTATRDRRRAERLPRRRRRSTSCASSASSAVPATSASSEPARPVRGHRQLRRRPADPTLEVCPSGLTAAAREPLLPRRLHRRRRRALALAVGGVRGQRRLDSVVHPRRAAGAAARRDDDRRGRDVARRLVARRQGGRQAPALERRVHGRRTHAPVQRRRLHGAPEPAHGEGVARLAELEPGAYTFEKSAAFEVAPDRNLSGLDLGQLYELNGRLKLRNFASVLLAADAGPARFDDREVGNGTALQRARLPRRAFRARQRSARPGLRDARQPDAVHGRRESTRPPPRPAWSSTRSASWTSSCCRRSPGPPANTATRARSVERRPTTTSAS